MPLYGSTLHNPAPLYIICIEYILPVLERIGIGFQSAEETKEAGPIDKIAGSIAEDLLNQAIQDKTHWKNEWKIFLTPKISSCSICWSKELLQYVGQRCKRLKRIHVKYTKDDFDPLYLHLLPKSVCTLDFDGELIMRGRSTFPSLGQSNWLPEAEQTLKALSLSRKTITTWGQNTLAEVHLGKMAVTAEQLIIVLQYTPQIRLLRHYQMVTALCRLHGDSWRKGDTLTQYKLRNLDADFSHVVRCRMSPQAVLPGDVMRLVTTLCPEATSVRVRIDCSTPNDVLSPLCGLKRVKELSVVCVTSGERTLLDFSDITPILETYGQSSLKSLELKVIEEVDTHTITLSCPRLEELILSGCGYVAPPTCPYFNCKFSTPYLRHLKLLFYADGDDFSWDHNVPDCFWKSTLATGMDKRSQLIGIFLESPRITEQLSQTLWPKVKNSLYQYLKAFSVCRYDELSLENINEIVSGAPLKYLRVSNCGKINTKRLNQIITTPELTVHTD